MQTIGPPINLPNLVFINSFFRLELFRVFRKPRHTNVRQAVPTSIQMGRSGTRSGSGIFTNPHEVASFRPSVAPATQRFDLISIYSRLISENNPQASLVLLGHTIKSYYITTLNQNTLSVFQCPVGELPSLPENKLPSESKCPHCLYFTPTEVIHHPLHSQNQSGAKNGQLLLKVSFKCL